MKLTCPSCNYSAEIDPSRIPAIGIHATCPKCKGIFLAAPPKDNASVISCPKCGLEQAEGASHAPDAEMVRSLPFHTLQVTFEVTF